MGLQEETQPMSSNSDENKIEPPQKPQTAQQWLFGIFTVAVGAVLVAVVLGGVDWMTAMNTQLTTLNVKVDNLTTAINQLQSLSGEVKAIDKRVQRIEDTRFSDTDAQRLIAPIEHRLERLESGRRR